MARANVDVLREDCWLIFWSVLLKIFGDFMICLKIDPQLHIFTRDPSHLFYTPRITRADLDWSGIFEKVWGAWKRRGVSLICESQRILIRVEEFSNNDKLRLYFTKIQCVLIKCKKKERSRNNRIRKICLEKSEKTFFRKSDNPVRSFI